MKAFLALVLSSLLSVSAWAQGVYTDGSGYAYAPRLISPPSAFGSIAASFKALAAGPSGAGIFWNDKNSSEENYGNWPSVVLWLANGNNGYVRPYFQISDGYTRFSRAGPWILYDDYTQHTVTVAYAMVQIGNYISKFMDYWVDGQYYPDGSYGSQPGHDPAYAFKVTLDNGAGYYAAYPADGGGYLGAVNFHPNDLSASVGVPNPNGAAVWLRGNSDLWYNQIGIDLPFWNQGFIDVSIDEMLAWP
jgi:hypothetical protein